VKTKAPSNFQSSDIKRQFQALALDGPEPKKPKYPRIDRRHGTIDFTLNYSVPLDRSRTHQEILQWVVHLTEKPWMTTEANRIFVRLACEYHKIPPYTTPSL
jgi:hypothetical protein